MVNIRTEAANTATRVNAGLRITLRRWLRAKFEGDMPDHLWLDYDLPDLIDEVSSSGGDVDSILDRAREEIVDKIAQDMGYSDD